MFLFQMALLIAGIIALAGGKGGTRIVGVFLMLPMPLAFCSGYIYGLSKAALQQTINPHDPMYLLVDWGFLALCLTLALTTYVVWGKKSLGQPHAAVVNQADGSLPSAGWPVWYSSASHFRQLLKFSLTTERGIVEASHGHLQFRGGATYLDLRGITDVSLTGLYWPSLFAVAWSIGLCFVASAIGVFSFLTLHNPATYVVFVALTIFCLAAWPLWWVRVEYRDEQGTSTDAYFADASALTKNFGGTTRLARCLRECLATGTATTDIPMAEPIRPVGFSGHAVEEARAHLQKPFTVRLMDNGLLFIEIGIMVQMLATVGMIGGVNALFYTGSLVLGFLASIVVSVGMWFCVGTEVAKPFAILTAGVITAAPLSILLLLILQATMMAAVHGALVAGPAVLATISAFCLVNFLKMLAGYYNEPALARKMFWYVISLGGACLLLILFGAFAWLYAKARRHDASLYVMLIFTCVVAEAFLAWLIGLVHSVRLLLVSDNVHINRS